MEAQENRKGALNRILEDPKRALLSLAGLTLLIAGVMWFSFSGGPRLAGAKDNPYTAARNNQSSKLSLFAWGLTPGWARNLARNIFSWSGSSAWADNLDSQIAARRKKLGGKEGKGGGRDGDGYAGGDEPQWRDEQSGEWEIGPDGQRRRRAKSRGGPNGDISASATAPGSLGGAGGIGGSSGGSGTGGAPSGAEGFDGIAMASGDRGRAGAFSNADRDGGAGRSLGRRGSAYRTGLGSAKGLKDGEVSREKGGEDEKLPEKPPEFRPGTPPTKLTRASPGQIASVGNVVAGSRDSVKNRLITDNLNAISMQSSRIISMVPKVQTKVNAAAGKIMNDMAPLQQAERTMLAVPSRFGKYGLTTGRNLPNLDQLPRLADTMKYNAGGLGNVKSAAEKTRKSAGEMLQYSLKAVNEKVIDSTRSDSMVQHMNMEQGFSQFESADRTFWELGITHHEKIWQPWDNTIKTGKELDGLIKNTLIPKEAKLASDLSSCRNKKGADCSPIERELKMTREDLALAQKDLVTVDHARARFNDQYLSVNGNGTGIYSEFRAVQNGWEPERHEFAAESKFAGSLAGARDRHKDDIEKNDLLLNPPDVKDMVPVIDASVNDMNNAQQNLHAAYNKGNVMPQTNDQSVWAAQKPPGVPEHFRRVNDPKSAVYAARADANAVEAALRMREEELHLNLHEQAALNQKKEDERFAKQEAERQKQHAEAVKAYEDTQRARCAAQSVSGAACP